MAVPLGRTAGGPDATRGRLGVTRFRSFLVVFWVCAATGCTDCDRSASYVRADEDVRATDASDVGSDAADLGADMGNPRDVGGTEDAAAESDGGAADARPDLGLPPACPWALSGCVALAPTDPEDCGPLGCGQSAPATLWVDALPCLADVNVTLPPDSAWSAEGAGEEGGVVAFDLVVEGRGRTQCSLAPQGISFYPEALRCEREGEPTWSTPVFMNAAACEACPPVQGCYIAEGFEPSYPVALFQDGCVVTVAAEPSGGRQLPTVAAVGPEGQLIFRLIGQVADTICALPPPNLDGVFDGFACAHSQAGLPGDIESVDGARLVPAPWSDCPFVECVEDADCAGNPNGELCQRGSCGN